jgi:putative tryptophan/tyrosine transport system substrate-binding protein
MRRRQFISLLGGAAAWSFAARAQQPATPVIGFLSVASPGDAMRTRLAAFRQGLSDAGYVEDRNVSIEYRWAEGRFDRLSELAADLVSRRVSVIATPGNSAGTRAAKALTTTIPIVFGVAEDPVALGLVASLGRPGGNLTGVNFLNNEVTEKRLGLLRDLVPGLAHVAVLVNPASGTNAETTLRDAQAAARAMGLHIQVLNASTNTRSMRPSQTSRANGPMPSSWVATPFSTIGVSSWSTWHRAMRSRQYTRTGFLQKSAG